MLIINADDWGRSPEETDAALHCFKAGRITSTTAMVFMRDSERAAELARAIGIDVGLHLNFDEAFSGQRVPEQLTAAHEKTRAYLSRSKYSQLLYNPRLRKQFDYSYKRQREEFERLFGHPPSHIDGHHHMHLCANVVFGNVIPAHSKIRRPFSFGRGEKGWLKRAYRDLVYRWSKQKYRMPQYFYDLGQCLQSGVLHRVAALSHSSSVELMSHPGVRAEMEYLLGDEFGSLLQLVECGSYGEIKPAEAQSVN